MSTGQELQRAQPFPPAVLQARDFLDQRKAQIEKWVRGGVQAEALVRFTLQDLQSNKKLQECDPVSIYLALLACAVTGLEPGGLKQEAFLVPYNREAKFIAGWRGLQKQALRSGGVKMLTASVVHEHDQFDMDLGVANSLVHKPSFRERGEVIGAYAWAQLSNGFRQMAWVPREDLDKIQRGAEAKGSPAWKEWPDEMRAKTAIRRLAKHLPMGDDYYDGARIENARDDVDGSGVSYHEVLDSLTDGDATRGQGAAITSAAAFGALPPANITAPAARPAKTTAAKPAASKPPIDAAATERPTTAGAAPTPAPSAAASAAPAPSAGPAASAARPAPAATPSSSSPASSASASTSTASASAPATPAPATVPADTEPTPSEALVDEGDTSFDTSSFGGEDPVDSEPEGPPPAWLAPTGVPTLDQVNAFVAWMKTATPLDLKQARNAWIASFKDWLNTCQSQAEITDQKDSWMKWVQFNFKASRPAANGKPAVAGDPEATDMQNAFKARWMAVPA
jgi:recombination protein RecT